MSSVMLVLASAGVGMVCLGAGYIVGKISARGALAEADRRHQALRRDFDNVSAVNVRLMSHMAPTRTAPDQDATERFLEVYDAARRCLHRTLAQHNATTARPIVIARDGGNLLEVLDELPDLSFSQDAGEDAGVRVWLQRVFETETERRTSGRPLGPAEVQALEGERSLWVVLTEGRP